MCAHEVGGDAPLGLRLLWPRGRLCRCILGTAATYNEAIESAYIRGILVYEITTEDFEALVALAYTGWNGRLLSSLCSGRRNIYHRNRTVFSEVRSPVKIIWGEDDLWIPLDRGMALHQFMTCSEFAPIPGTGHMPQLEKSAPVLQEFSAFLR